VRQPGVEGRSRAEAGRRRVGADGGDALALAMLVGLRAGDDQQQAALGNALDVAYE
jgi:hypothetical protein